MKTLKTVVNIIIVALIFALPAQAQSAKAVSKNDKEKIEFKTLNDFVKYQEAVEAGEIKPMDEAELAIQYNRLIQKMDEEFHNPQMNKNKSDKKKDVISVDMEPSLPIGGEE